MKKATLRAKPRAQTGQGKVPSSPRTAVGEIVKLKTAKGQLVSLSRDLKTGSFTTPRSTSRIRDTSMRAADSLKRLAKR